MSLFAVSAAKIRVGITNQCTIYIKSMYISQALLVTWTISEAGSRYVQKRSCSEKLHIIIRKISYDRFYPNPCWPTTCIFQAQVFSWKFMQFFRAVHVENLSKNCYFSNLVNLMAH